jgi:type I restriction enzyme, S subunit
MNRAEFSEGEDMSEWRDCSLGEVITLQRGFDITRNQQKVGDYPVVSSSGIKSYHNEWKVKGPGVVIGRKGTLGTVFYVKSDFWAHDTTLWVKDFHTNDPLFVYYFLKEFDLGRYDVGSSNPTLNRNHVHLLAALLPPLPEQKAIASILSSLDDKIDLLHRQNKTLEAIAETLFRQWFIEEAQADWEEGTIADLIDFNPSRKLTKGSTVPYLEMAALSNSTFNPIGWYDRIFSSGTKFINGDTLLARITPCLENGKTAYITFLQKGQVAWGSTEYIVMRPKHNIHPFFAYTLARNSDFRDYAEGCLEGSSGRQRVNVDHLKNYGMKIPSKKVIDDFNLFAESIVPKLTANSNQIPILEKLRDTLLPKLMSGEVRVEI